MKTKNFMICGSFLLFALLLSGCAKDSSSNPTTTDIRSKFLGNWLVNEQWNKLTYEVSIAVDNNSTNGVYISNFSDAGTGITAYALVAGSNISLTKDEYLSNSWIVNGGGVLSGTTKINWTYTRDDGANLIYATATYTKN